MLSITSSSINSQKSLLRSFVRPIILALATTRILSLEPRIFFFEHRFNDVKNNYDRGLFLMNNLNMVMWFRVTIIICEMFSALLGLFYDFVHCDKFWI